MASGEGVTVAIVGTPFAHDHAEIKSAYNQRASYDFRTTSTRAETMRSTQLAGVVAGERGNGKCGVGIAWGANISSIGLSEQMLETGDDHLYTALTFSADDNGRLLLFSLRKIERFAMRIFSAQNNTFIAIQPLLWYLYSMQLSLLVLALCAKPKESITVTSNFVICKAFVHCVCRSYKAMFRDQN